MSELETTTKLLGERYAAWKENGEAKDGHRNDFFAEATRVVQESYELEEKLLTVEAATIEEASARVERYHPRFRVDVIRVHKATEHATTYEAILVERPEYVSFTFVNAEDGKVYTRSVSEGALTLDDERLLAEDPDLHSELCFTLPWGDTVLMPLERLADAMLSKLRKYLYHGKPSAKLLPPRAAKPEELEQVA